MNKVILTGRLTRDPETKYSNGSESIAVTKFNLTVDRRQKKEGEQNADFISCVAFRGGAESIGKWCRQGTRIAIEGRIQTGSYVNKDGQKVYTTDVIVESWEFAGGKSDNSGNTGSAGGNNGGYVGPGNVPSYNSDGFMNIPEGVEDSGLPF